MAPDADPYRTLGLSRGATLDDVKRAYRQLAKANHPDAAGEAALPRFLAIQAAYERLIGGSATSAKGRRTSSSPSRPWEAGPVQGDATRRASGRARNTPPGASRAGTRPGPATGGAGGGRPTSGAGAAAGSTTGRARRGGPAGPRPSAGRSPGEPTRGTKGRPPNKATFGSTSYDGADAGPFEPDWGGASWYGTTSGTYWTLNPKEYADPRKHGPEYQARARRAARARAGPSATEGTEDETQTDLATDPAAHARPGDPTHTTSSWWDSTAGPEDPTTGPSFAGPAADGRGRSRPWDGSSSRATDDAPPPDLGRAVGDIVRALTDDRFGGVRGRLVRAIIGWLPIALGLGWGMGELTGCGRFAASCDGGASEPVLLALQVAAFVVLLLIPAIASVAAAAALALLVAAVVASLILSATGAAADSDARRTVLGVVLLLGWLAGLGVAIVRRVRTLRTTTSPVS